MSGDETTTQVPNPYLSAIRARRSQSIPLVAELKARLDTVHTALTSGAWVSTQADSFGGELSGHRTTLTSAGDGTLQEYDDAIAGQPEMVPDDAWQTHWRNLR